MVASMTSRSGAGQMPKRSTHESERAQNDELAAIDVAK